MDFEGIASFGMWTYFLKLGLLYLTKVNRHVVSGLTSESAKFQGPVHKVVPYSAEATGNIAPAVPIVDSSVSPAETRMMHERAARSDLTDPRSAFQFSSGMQIQEVEPYVTLVSSDTTHYQSMLYKVLLALMIAFLPMLGICTVTRMLCDVWRTCKA